METLKHDTLFQNETLDLIKNQKRIDMIFDNNHSDEFYLNLIKEVKREFGEYKNFKINSDFLFSTFLFNILHESLNVFKKEYSTVEQFYFEEELKNKGMRIIEIVWNLINNVKIIEENGFQMEIINFTKTHRLSKKNFEKALIYFLSSDNFGAKFEFDQLENQKIYNYIKSKNKIDLTSFCIYLNLLEMYQDVDISKYSNSKKLIKKALVKN